VVNRLIIAIKQANSDAGNLSQSHVAPPFGSSSHPLPFCAEPNAFIQLTRVRRDRIMFPSWPKCQLLIALSCLIFIAGCGRDDSPQGVLARVNKSNIQRLANLYHKYQSEHRWVGPPNEDAFRKYVQSLPPSRLEMLGIKPNDLDGLFRSERDGEEFVFRYNVPGSAMGKVDPVVFERVGVKGKRMVGFTNKPPIEVAAELYDDYLAGNFSPDNQIRQAGAIVPPGGQ